MRRRGKILLGSAAAFAAAALVIVRGEGPNAQLVVSTAASRVYDAAGAEAYYQPGGAFNPAERLKALEASTAPPDPKYAGALEVLADAHAAHEEAKKAY